MRPRARVRQLQAFGADGLRELANRCRYGVSAPRPYERLWIDPRSVERATAWFDARSAAVVHQWPPAPDMPFEDHPHVARALAHWRDGSSWQDVGAQDYMLRQIAHRGRQDGCLDLDDVLRRFARLDAMHGRVGRDGRLLTRQELSPRAFRERGGIVIHIDPRGRPIAGDGGKHRLTVARLHGLTAVPVCLGVVHVDALSRLPELRRAPSRVEPLL